MMRVFSLLPLVCGALSTLSSAQQHAPSTDTGRPAQDSTVMIAELDSAASFHDALAAQIKRARALGRTPFLDIGATWCGPCQTLLALLQKKPADPVLLQEFAGVYVVEVDYDQWKDGLDSLGFQGPSIPTFLAIDTTGQMIEQSSGDNWNVDAPEGLRPLQAFFQAHAWKPQDGTHH